MSDSTATASSARTPWYARAISRTAASPSGWRGRLLARIWLSETAAINDRAVQLLDAGPGSRLLELGFGPGRTIGRLAASGAHVIGVDVSPQMVALARRRNRAAVLEGGVTLDQGDGTALPAGDGAVDAALSVHNLYFWPDRTAVFAELARVVRPGGRLVLGIRDPELAPPRKADPDIYTFLPFDDLRDLFHQAGFEAVEVLRSPGNGHEAVLIVATRRRDGGSSAS